MSQINFVKLCEALLCESVFDQMALLDEAVRENLIDIARQAKSWKEKYTTAKTKDQKVHARQQLIILQDFLRDEFGRSLSDEQFVDAIEKSSFYDMGLVFLKPSIIRQMR